MSTALTQGIHHLGLTVPNIEETKAFFVSILGFKQVGEKPEYPAVFVSDGTTMLTLWQAENPESAVAFNRRRNIGLHHFALRVADNAALDQLCESIRVQKELDIEIEFESEGLGQSGLRHMMCRIPGNIRLELIAA